MSRVVARFKEFLKVIKAHIVARLTKGNEGKENVRCITDVNEVMWFHFKDAIIKSECIISCTSS